jgi:hypothetical protein
LELFLSELLLLVLLQRLVQVLELQQLAQFQRLERFQLGLPGRLAQLELPLGPLKGPLLPALFL